MIEGIVILVAITGIVMVFDVISNCETHSDYEEFIEEEYTEIKQTIKENE